MMDGSFNPSFQFVTKHDDQSDDHHGVDHLEQCDKILRFDQEFGLPSSTHEPVARCDDRRVSRVSMEQTEDEVSECLILFHQYWGWGTHDMTTFWDAVSGLLGLVSKV